MPTPTTHDLRTARPRCCGRLLRVARRTLIQQHRDGKGTWRSLTVVSVFRCPKCLKAQAWTRESVVG